MYRVPLAGVQSTRRSKCASCAHAKVAAVLSVLSERKVAAADAARARERNQSREGAASLAEFSKNAGGRIGLAIAPQSFNIPEFPTSTAGLLVVVLLAISCIHYKVPRKNLRTANAAIPKIIVT